MLSFHSFLTRQKGVFLIFYITFSSILAHIFDLQLDYMSLFSSYSRKSMLFYGYQGYWLISVAHAYMTRWFLNPMEHRHLCFRLPHPYFIDRISLLFQINHVRKPLDWLKNVYHDRLRNMLIIIWSVVKRAHGLLAFLSNKLKIEIHWLLSPTRGNTLHIDDVRWQLYCTMGFVCVSVCVRVCVCVCVCVCCLLLAMVTDVNEILQRGKPNSIAWSMPGEESIAWVFYLGDQDASQRRQI